MNQFTKDELLTILWTIDYTRRTNNSNDAMRSLQAKVIMIIDNYCDPVCPECKDEKCLLNYKCVNQGYI